MKRVVRTATHQLELNIDQKGDQVYAAVTGAGSHSQRRELRFKVLSRSGPRWIIESDGEILESIVLSNSATITVLIDNDTYQLEVFDPRDRRLHSRLAGGSQGAARVVAQMPGKVVRVLVEPGQHVEAEQGLAVVEAMKMQNEIRSPRQGTVTAVNLQEGSSLVAGQLLFEIGEEEH